MLFRCACSIGFTSLAHVCVVAIGVAAWATTACGQVHVDRFNVDLTFPGALDLSRNGQFVVGGFDTPWIFKRSSGVLSSAVDEDPLASVWNAIAVSDDGRRIIGMGQSSNACDDETELFAYSIGPNWSKLVGSDSEFGGLSADGQRMAAAAYQVFDRDDCPGEAKGPYEAGILLVNGGVSVLTSPIVARPKPIDVSSDASVIVGNGIHTVTPEGNWLKQAIVWDGENNVAVLPIPANRIETVATAISADGKTIVGYSRTSDITPQLKAFRWNAATGIVELPQLNIAESISSDGSLVIGRERGRDVVWRVDGSVMSLDDYLSEFGFAATGFEFIDMSDDGQTFLGTQDGEFVVVTVPEPVSIAGAISAFIAVLIVQRRWRCHVRSTLLGIVVPLSETRAEVPIDLVTVGNGGNPGERSPTRPERNRHDSVGSMPFLRGK